MKNKATTTRWIVESAIMLAIATVLSELTFSGPWALGGGITFCSMLPIILISFRYDCKRGLVTGVAFSLLQLILGIHNVQYADSAIMAAGIVLFDYIVPFSVLGLAGLFRNVTKTPKANLVIGITVTLFVRFLCHFATGIWIWEALWPNELGWAAPIWSLAYNASYMIPELIITVVVAVLLYASPLKTYFDGKDLK